MEQVLYLFLYHLGKSGQRKIERLDFSLAVVVHQ